MSEIKSRKQAHLDICLHHNVEYGHTYLNEIQLIHKSLPELALSDIDTTHYFFGKKVSAPIFISSMTGGSKEGAIINMRLAKAAEEVGLPLGLGSIKILFEHENLISEFQIRSLAPSIPIFANLGVTQLRYISHNIIYKMLDTLKVDGIALHINPAQELSQHRSEEIFSNLIPQIYNFISRSPFPVIIKETGHGIMPTEAKLLLGQGAKYVDIAGSGGTNWAKVEHIRNEMFNFPNHSHPQEDIYELGTSTALLMLGLYRQKGILASGGIRSAMDITRCLVLGAESVGLALPILKHVVISTESTIDYLQNLILHLAQTMLLCGAKNISDTKNIPFYIGQFLQKEFISFSQALNLDIPQKIRQKLS